MRKLALLTLLFMFSATLWGQNQVGTFITGSDWCTTNYLAYAQLGASYHCTVTNQNAAVQHTFNLNDFDTEGPIIGFQSCSTMPKAPYKAYMRDEVQATTCQCDHWKSAMDTVVINHNCNLLLSAWYYTWFETCTD